MVTILLLFLSMAQAAPAAKPVPLPEGAADDGPVAAYVNYFNAVRAAETEKAIEYVRCEDDAQKQLVREAVPALTAIERLKATLAERFGADAVEELNTGLPPASTLASFEAEIDGDEARITGIAPDTGNREPFLTLTREGDRWMLPLDTITELEADPQAHAIQAKAITETAEELTRRVEAGEFNSVESVMTALVQGMMQRTEKALTEQAAE